MNGLASGQQNPSLIPEPPIGLIKKDSNKSLRFLLGPVRPGREEWEESCFIILKKVSPTCCRVTTTKLSQSCHECDCPLVILATCSISHFSSSSEVLYLVGLLRLTTCSSNPTSCSHEALLQLARPTKGAGGGEHFNHSEEVSLTRYGGGEGMMRRSLLTLSGNERGKHNSLSCGAGLGQP